MSSLPSTVLVVGGGIAGMSAAIRLREAGVVVTLIDKDPNWSVYGAGITCSPLTFRALWDLGIGGEVVAQGAPHNAVALYDLSGNPITRMELPRLLGEDIDAAGGIMRPDLHRILSDKVKGLGTQVRLGLTVSSIDQDKDKVTVEFDDGTKESFGLVIGADGIGSSLRDMVLDAGPKPTFTGQACWRAMFDLPPEWVSTGVMFLSPKVKTGFTPCAPGRMYLYVLEAVPDNPWREAAEMPGLLKELLKDAGGKLAELRDEIGPDTEINYRPLESVLVDGDWYNGRVVLIGDAVHATTPHLAAGAGMAVEDAIVLVDELQARPTLEAALAHFMERRLERAKLVVNKSLELGKLEMAGAPMPVQGALMQESSNAIAVPY